jgi:thiosulfate/3-mercaptopyruvate sulfurtransferase
MDTLVTTDWLAEHLDDPDLVVLDCTVRLVFGEEGGYDIESGCEEFEAGHIPSAGFADLTDELSDTESPHRFAVPAPEDFCAAMGALGVGDASRVVLYDGWRSVWAARVWWMLRWVGFDRAALLDGGLELWKEEVRPLASGPSTSEPATLIPALRPGLIADMDEVRRAIGDDSVALVDTLPAEHYTGEMKMYQRAGHIPGASNLDALELLDESGRYRPLEELEAMHAGDREGRVITYCGGGIAASSNAFVMTRLGFTDLAVYTASLQEWTAGPDNPMVVEAS